MLLLCFDFICHLNLQKRYFIIPEHSDTPSAIPLFSPSDEPALQ